MQELSIFKYKDCILEYEELSKGNKKMLCFNGYGKVTKDFHVYRDFFDNDIHAIGVNLPYHGKSNWNLGAGELHELFKSFLRFLQWNSEDLHLLAYSIGARYTYLLAQLFPNKIQTIYLIAPDGIYPNTISNFATFNSLGQSLMNLFIKRAELVILILKYLNYFNVLSENDLAFFMRKISTKDDRKMLQNVWKEVYTNTPDFKDTFQITRGDIHWNIILGKTDKVFPYTKMVKLVPSDKSINLYSWDSGHAMLKESIGYKLSLLEKTTIQE